MSAARQSSFRSALCAIVTVLAVAGCAAPGGEKPAEMSGKDVLRNVLGGYSIGGVSVGAAAGAAMSAAEMVRDIPESEEIVMGRDVAAGLLGAAPLVRNAPQQRYLNQVGRWVALNSGRPDLPWKFGILDVSTVNAFATPGGYVFVTRGLIERIRTESELAGVLAHEIAHVVQKHHLADIKKQAGKSFVLDVAALKSGGLTGEAARAVARVGLEGFVRGLSREDELEADRIGIAIAARAGYEPYGLVAVLQTLASTSRDDSAMALFLSTHPSPGDRLAALETSMPASWDAFAKPNPALSRFDPVFLATGAGATPALAPVSATPADTTTKPGAAKPPAAKPPPKPAPTRKPTANPKPSTPSAN